MHEQTQTNRFSKLCSIRNTERLKQSLNKFSEALFKSLQMVCVLYITHFEGCSHNRANVNSLFKIYGEK
jgi:hypothetical protein